MIQWRPPGLSGVSEPLRNLCGRSSVRRVGACGLRHQAIDAVPFVV